MKTKLTADGSNWNLEDVLEAFMENTPTPYGFFAGKIWEIGGQILTSDVPEMFLKKVVCNWERGKTLGQQREGTQQTIDQLLK